MEIQTHYAYSKDGARFLTAQDVAQRLNISLPSAYKLLRRKDCPVIRVGVTYRIDENQLSEYLDMLAKQQTNILAQ